MDSTFNACTSLGRITLFMLLNQEEECLLSLAHSGSYLRTIISQPCHPQTSWKVTTWPGSSPRKRGAPEPVREGHCTDNPGISHTVGPIFQILAIWPEERSFLSWPGASGKQMAQVPSPLHQKHLGATSTGCCISRCTAM